MLVRSMLRLCVCLSVTSWCSAKMAKHRIMQTMSYDCPGTLVFYAKHSENPIGLSQRGPNTGMVQDRDIVCTEG